jgi:putative endonuclease
MRTGQAGERHAERHLTRLGYRVVDRNFRTRFGELDLVVRRGDTVVFCEVRSRVGTPASGAVALALESIGPGKRRRLRAMAREWLSVRGGTGERGGVLRFDAIGVALDARGRLLALDHLEDAF